MYCVSILYRKDLCVEGNRVPTLSWTSQRWLRIWCAEMIVTPEDLDGDPTSRNLKMLMNNAVQFE